MNRDTFLLIDGMSLLFRAFYASSWTGSVRQTSTGLYTNAVYGFTRMMLQYADMVQPSHLAVAWDVASRESLVRSQWFPGYKANRVDPPAELLPQFDLVKELTAAFDVPNVGVPGYEGDDVLGTLGERFAQEGHSITIVSGDYDTLQLVSDRISVKILKNGGKHEHFTPFSLHEMRGITPEQVVDVKALQGDPSDCIPGCPGIGEKTAIKLIQEYGNLDVLYEQIDAVPPRWRSKLEEHRELIYTSRRLATIFRDAPVELDSAQAVWSYERERVLEKFAELEFGKTALSWVG
ncbi:5'-3' exonuclease [Brevibacillus humidisoli]|uniref:5'-3' exonuclease n=1 Tax=Brevibacillus humidisoli TaxID=2895522 RepID=UPI001E5DAF62|nr:5'-3' exonuclease H3TH domain-containing protein [Brevibacillus humidisoli]UFJ42662.1 5'-3' exonuclease [Brevibacillus humidisoli]